MFRLMRFIAGAAVLFGTMAGAARAADQTQPANFIHDKAFGLVTPNADTASLTRAAESASADGGMAVLRVQIKRPTEPFYQVQVAAPVPAELAEGHRLRFSFRARSESRNPMRAVIEKSGPPWTAVAEIHPQLGTDWARFEVPFTVQTTYPKDGVSIRFQVGHQAGMIELADVRLEDLGPDPEWTAAEDALRPEAIAQRIQKYRMADLTIELRDAAGKPVSGAGIDIHVRQVRHAFLFGANIFNLQPASHEPWQFAYQERYTALLNYATLPFYWSAFEPRRGAPEYDRLDAMARWCTDHHVTTKGHPLVWHETYPGWAPRTAEGAIPLLEHRVQEIVRHYSGPDAGSRRISYWDVLNEVNNAADTTPPNGESNWVARDGGPTVVATALGWARQAAALPPDSPDSAKRASVIYNDFNTGAANVALLRELARRNALPDVIGIQSHMHDGAWPLPAVWRTCEEFAQFQRPIHFTEVTVLSGPSRAFDPRHEADDWVTTPEGEITQADYVERFYTLLFSHPSVRAITWWDFSDRGAWRKAPAGLVRKDMSPKPAYDRLMKLIHGAWWTDRHLAADSEGEASLRAFQGEYELTAKLADGKTIVKTGVMLPAEGQSIQLNLP